MRKWTDEEIKEWNIKTFEPDAIMQLNKVEEELLEVEKAKRRLFTSQYSKDYNEIYFETADAYIAAVGLSRYPEYSALSRFLRNYIYNPIGVILDPFIDEKMEINITRKFVKKGNTQHH